MSLNSLIIFCLTYHTILCIPDQNKFQHEALMSHNLYRYIHGVPKLSLNKNLSKIALNRAQELAQSKNLVVKQFVFNEKKLGETIGFVNGFNEYNGISATQLWYSMVSKFDHEGENSYEAASFSQLIWKSTTEVGFGIAEDDGKFYFVAEYFPSGNIPGEYEENVFQLNISNDLLSSSNDHPTNIGKILTGIVEISRAKKNND